MNEIYILSQGEYDDVHIIGAYSTKELAQEMSDKMKPAKGYDDWNTPFIRPYAIDPYIKEIRQGLKLYFVWMKDNGEVTSCKQEKLSECRNISEIDTGGSVSGSIFARDKQHAIQQVEQIRLQAIVEGKIKQE